MFCFSLSCYYFLKDFLLKALITYKSTEFLIATLLNQGFSKVVVVDL